ncbi:hypothetical protein MLD38_023965 [Melastoma candidum]|uniref:Uncharacterized protein n=1 Tax=Melastoma candidum TaxID=119954 RepID=A0ACB9NQY1_9MYRT|nr:hypothetical protein MLD38_023965 [Melastoma candidum]
MMFLTLLYLFLDALDDYIVKLNIVRHEFLEFGGPPTCASLFMSLLDLLSADFMNPRMQRNGRLQLWSNVSLLFGAGCMSLLAKWA